MSMALKPRTPLCLAIAFWASAVPAGNLYGHVDDFGRVHLSSAALDSRYARLRPVAQRYRLSGTGSPESAHSFQLQVTEAAQAYQVDPALLQAMIAVESGFDPAAVSSKGAAGLMQLMPETAQRYGVADRFDPGQNIRGGARYLRDLLQRFNNDVSLALAAYNAGEGAVIQSGGRIPAYPETQAYVPKVLERYRNYLRDSLRHKQIFIPADMD